MIEAIANRLGVDITEVDRIALDSKNPVMLPGKCGIFCQSAVVSQLNKGRPKSDILMGVCRALVGKLPGRPDGHGFFHSIYNTIWYGKNGFDGIIHLLPLSCMPESTVETIVDQLALRAIS